MTEERTLAEIYWEKLINENDYSQAERFYEKTKQNGQLTPEMSYVMGLWHHQRENYRKAADALLDGLVEMPASSELYYALANTMREMGNETLALEYYNNAIFLNPGYIDAYFAKGQLLGLMEEIEEAVESLCKAQQLAERTEEMIAIAVEMSFLEQSSLAIEIYFTALLKDPDNYYLYSNLGVELAELGEYSDAVFCHEKALSMTQSDPDVWYNAACTYALMNETLRSLLALEKSIELDPTNRDYAADDPELESLHKMKRFWKLIGRNEP